MRSPFSRRLGVMFGQVCIRGTRISVNFIKGRARGGESARKIARSYGQPLKTIEAAITYGRRR